MSQHYLQKTNSEPHQDFQDSTYLYGRQIQNIQKFAHQYIIQR